MTHATFKEMLTIHALSALDAGDERALEEHLQTCQECLNELDKWRMTASAIAFAGSVAEPSTEVRERLLSRIKAEPQSITSSSKGPSTSSAKVIPFDSPRTSVWSSLGSLGAIAASLLIGALLISLFVLWRDNRATNAKLQQLTAELDARNAELRQDQKFVAIAMRPGSRVMEIVGTKDAPSAHARIAYDKNGEAMLMAKGLPAAPTGKAYQLWFIVGSNKIPGRTFSPDTTGTGYLTDQIPAAAMGSAIFAVTLEPKEGVKVPTGNIFLVSGS